MSEPVHIQQVDDLDCRVEEFEWDFARREASRIADHWQGLVAERPRLFDGRVLLQHRSEVVEEKGARILRAHFFETSFSSFIAWRDFGFPDRSVRNCFAMGALRADDGFVLAEMGAHTANAGAIYFPAGTPDPSDVVGHRLDLAGSVLRELTEETGLAAHDVQADPGWHLVEAGPRLGCLRMLRIAGRARDVAAMIDARIALQENPELAGMYVAQGAADLDPQRMPAFIVAYLRRMFDAP